MSRCNWCRGDGLVFIRDVFDDGLAPGYCVASCTCGHGQKYRVKWQLRAWASQQNPKPEHIGRLEEFFTQAELNTLTTVIDDAPGVKKQVILVGF